MNHTQLLRAILPDVMLDMFYASGIKIITGFGYERQGTTLKQEKNNVLSTIT